MKISVKYFLLVFIWFFLVVSYAQSNHKFGIALHGGAGTILKKYMTPEKEKAYHDKLQEALEKGYSILENGGSSLDAVEAAINIMEDSPLFNAGKGAVFTANGINELDASIMDGKTLKAGAVARVSHIKNPISLARMVMEKSPHVLLVGDGAEQFAKEHGVKLVDSKYFFTKERWDALQKIKEQEKKQRQNKTGFLPKPIYSEPLDEMFGTVGVVALDKNGNLAAGTSTGGMTNKLYGRVGDSPIIGAGTYANNRTCAVSGTGWGEFFIRLNVAKDISDLMEYKGMSLKDAADEVIMKKLPALGGDGGVIAIDKDGNIAMPFNTEGMYRAYHIEGSEPVIKFYKQ
ncbi:isoaspartyl peptidase/L-asparaginase family protein [Melioribacteraceae bacterium 4301-Me]|uniref:isoaspartyl peptidase/L-asparaginase family protein n=1 Tax=Pyranulibacter aquaticus TaxID=3163344 RepID=UPI003598C320